MDRRRTYATTGVPIVADFSVNSVRLPIYYLRLRQADGHRAWLSPVWLGLQD